MTYAPHGSATNRVAALFDYDVIDAQTTRVKTRNWIGGGIAAVFTLVAFGTWAVVTADHRTPAQLRALPGAALAGTFELAVTDLRCGVDSVGPSGMEQRPFGQFCLLGVTVKNAGTEPELFDSGAQRVYDANGVAYAVADQAAVFLNDHETTLLDEIRPGDTVAGVLPFDVPYGARLSEVSVHGSMSTPGVRLLLPPEEEQ
ncbi:MULTISPECIES: DUF4352 domain-containing protein [Actinoplanes]|uniref:DUF4352 domain-containing protein n=1 Tax=Actinoplanes TaxID=1865 RepID=UPI0005F2B8BE|nr:MULTISPECIES: DUF4352 domain-containing protein [Actinoplanes]